jgi:ribosome-associated protein
MQRDFISELKFKATRSSGKGGQNVNKVSSKVEVSFDIPNSFLLSDEEKSILLTKLASKLTLDGVLKITCQEDRSQLVNKQTAVEKLNLIIKKALTPVKKRTKTKPSKASKERRLKTKKVVSDKKELRRKPL